MAGLGLSNAVQMYREGVDWRQKQDAQEAERLASEKARANRETANSAFAASLDADKAKWALAGAQGDYVPDDSAYLRAAQARAGAFAKAGDYDSYMRHAAQLSPIVTGIRQKALDQYGTDEAALAKAVYGTFLDGKDLTSADMVDGTGPDGKPGAKQVRLVLSDGTTRFMPAGAIRTQVERSVMSPEWKLKEAQHLWETQRIRETGKQNRETEGVKVTGRMTLADRQAALDRDLEEVRQTGKMTLADVEHRNRMGQIGATGAESRKTKATPSFGDRLISTPEGTIVHQIGLDGVLRPIASGGPKSGTTNWTGMAKDHFGQRDVGSLGGGRSATPNTLALAEAARSIYEANTAAGKTITPEQAMRLAAGQLKMTDGDTPEE